MVTHCVGDIVDTFDSASADEFAIVLLRRVTMILVMYE